MKTLPLWLGTLSSLLSLPALSASHFIHQVQGVEAQSSLVGQSVQLEAVVTQVSPNLKGFFIEEEVADRDTNPQTSEGLFVYSPQYVQQAEVGQIVRLTGTVKEHFDHTQVNDLTEFQVLLQQQDLPTAIQLTLPLASDFSLESLEGMQLELTQNLYLVDHYPLNRYGRIGVSANYPRYQPTQIESPGSDAQALATQQALDFLWIDDGSDRKNPTHLGPFEGWLSQKTLRLGDRISQTKGALRYSFGEYQLVPKTIHHSATNQRPMAPTKVEESVRVASFNLLNYFNGDGKGGGFPTSRGAESPTELIRQQAKLVAALTAMDADVFGMLEVENDYGEAFSALTTLTQAMNAANPSRNYGFVDPGKPIGSDQIAVALVYDQNQLSMVGEAKFLDASVDTRFNDQKNRPALITTLTDKTSKKSFTIAVNHFKSKGSPCEGDPDLKDGQGNCNQTRTLAAQALVDYLAAIEGEKIILGDLNSYAMEDPIKVITQAGWRNPIEDVHYSYLFAGKVGTLDYLFLTEELMARTRQAQTWSINADEAIALDYQLNDKSEVQQINWYQADAYRSSDHDPVWVDLQLQGPEPTEPQTPGLGWMSPLLLVAFIGLRRRKILR